jgi:hypothetical protein
MKEINIIDQPNNPIDGDAFREDLLGTSKHVNALVNFIKLTNTPITVGIQGSWGSGKTSLLNDIKYQLDPTGENKGEYYHIWVNAWEQSLMVSPEEALVKVLSSISNDILKADRDQKSQDDFRKNIKSGLLSVARLGANIAGGDKASEIVEEMIGEKGNSIKEIRAQLQEISKKIRNAITNPVKKIIVYVDDLDRIEPKNAVRILELLKNIFDVKGCVFVLAIDYEVIVKGLEDKFGKRTDANDWEFRAFFDKIIQLPFMMPTGVYDIPKYINKMLKSIDFIEEDLSDELVNNILSTSIGTNPRALKRLTNSLALISLFSKQNNDEPEHSIEKQSELLFAMVCIQIEYPQIFEHLAERPNFTDWNDNFAKSITKGSENKVDGKINSEAKEMYKAELNILSERRNGEEELFNDEWEQALFKICYVNPRLKTKVEDLSKLFNYLKNTYFSNEKGELIASDEITDIISSVIGETAITSVTVTEDSKQSKPVKKFQRDIKENLDEFISEYAAKLNSNSTEILKKLTLYFEQNVLTLNSEMDKRHSKTHPLVILFSNQKIFGLTSISGKNLSIHIYSKKIIASDEENHKLKELLQSKYTLKENDNRFEVITNNNSYDEFEDIVKTWQRVFINEKMN